MVFHRPEFTEALPELQRSGLVAASGDKLETARLFRGRGCARCGGTGYSGRIVICELFEIDAEIRKMISKHSDGSLFRATGIRQGMRTMFHDGLEKALLGETTIDELIRATT
jgi:type II secretory ATPase GspE/PulE/Tfp pilus assembly ATPase PilB-like protein